MKRMQLTGIALLLMTGIPVISSFVNTCPGTIAVAFAKVNAKILCTSSFTASSAHCLALSVDSYCISR